MPPKANKKRNSQDAPEAPNAKAKAKAKAKARAKDKAKGKTTKHKGGSGKKSEMTKMIEKYRADGVPSPEIRKRVGSQLKASRLSQLLKQTRKQTNVQELMQALTTGNHTAFLNRIQQLIDEGKDLVIFFFLWNEFSKLNIVNI
eukprot:gnl/MRDRNA2_/MRDRNA2_57231_c0_seq1.p2 gnl/MRDRNA2_/MRDRNA2_57231_c0~~gnl/MRDRNA2_/MRDRNA2_57231_c0_seq1.p2  ORF type:complete len:144 (+),score=31.72 gnl/MRDRNA2_/MRDRNA2_57231_c0_seq1:138-569(+)